MVNEYPPPPASRDVLERPTTRGGGGGVTPSVPLPRAPRFLKLEKLKSTELKPPPPPFPSSLLLHASPPPSAVSPLVDVGHLWFCGLCLTASCCPPPPPSPPGLLWLGPVGSRSCWRVSVGCPVSPLVFAGKLRGPGDLPERDVHLYVGVLEAVRGREQQGCIGGTGHCAEVAGKPESVRPQGERHHWCVWVGVWVCVGVCVPVCGPQWVRGSWSPSHSVRGCGCLCLCLCLWGCVGMHLGVDAGVGVWGVCGSVGVGVGVGG